jgi:hypothetical protein
MLHIIDKLTTPSLERLAGSIENRLIRGDASPLEIDLYMHIQMTLGGRLVAVSEVPLDPRD